MLPGALTAVLRQLRSALGVRAGTDGGDGESLTRFVRQRDEAAFAALMARHGPMVLALCRRVLRHEQDAEDAFQATFLVLARRAGAIRQQQSVAGWLARVAYRIALSARERRAHRQHQERQVVPVSLAEPSSPLAAQELGSLLDQELHRLPRRFHEPLVLCYVEGHTYEEAARQLACPLGTLKLRLQRGRELLRGRLARHGACVGVLGQLPVAGVPAALADATARAAGAFAAGKGAGPASAAAVALAHETLRAVTLARRLLAGTVLALAVVGATVAIAYQQSAVPPGEGKKPEAAARFDAHGDLLPRGAVARLGTLRFRYLGTPERSHVLNTRFSPDGKLIASASRDENRVRLWDAASGKQVSELHMDGLSHDRLAFSPDGKLLAAWVGMKGAPAVVAFSPDGRTLATVNGHSVYLWEVATGKLRQEVTGARGTLGCVAFGPDGRQLAMLDDPPKGEGKSTDVIRIWDAASGKSRVLIDWPGPRLSGLAWSPEGGTLAAISDRNEVQLWDARSGLARARITLPKFGSHLIFDMGFSPDGKLLATQEGYGRVQLWEVASGKLVRTMQGQVAHSCGPSFSPDGKLLTGGSCGLGVRVWEVATGRDMVATRGHYGRVHHLAFVEGGKALVSLGEDGTARVWDVATRAERGQIGAFMLRNGAVSPSGKLVALPDYQRGAVLRDLDTGALVNLLSGALGRRVLTFSADGKWLAAEVVHRLFLFDGATGKSLRELEGHKGQVVAAAFAPDGKLLVSATHDLKAGEADGGRRLKEDVIDHTLRVWDTAAGKELRRAEAHVDVLASSPDGKTFASGNQAGEVTLWDVATLTPRVVAKLDAAVGALAFAPDGKTLAAGSQGADLVLYDVATGRARRRLEGQSGIGCLAFAPDGHTLAAGGSDTTILLWDVQE
jgi:RNA polymerase sigma factor (sigma-70 family)